MNKCVSSLKHSLQTPQNSEFTYTKRPYTAGVQKTEDVIAVFQMTDLRTVIYYYRLALKIQTNR